MNKNKKKTTTEEKKTEFELCKVCRINHSQGRRHNYFPRHTNSLSSLFSRFHNKLSRVKFNLKNPSLTSLDDDSQASSNRIWCIFCDCDIDELDSSFTSGNAIKHLASEDHLKNLKHFLWKYGGGMDKVESFRVTEDDLAKWEKKCEVLRKEAASSSKDYCGPLLGHSNDIQPNYEITNSFDNNIHCLESNLSKYVMPLQYDTNENYQVYQSYMPKTGKVVPFVQAVASPTPLTSHHGLNNWNAEHTSHNSRDTLFSTSTQFFANGFQRAKVQKNRSMSDKEPVNEGYQILTRISSAELEGVGGNVHSGAPPPWLAGTEAEGKLGLPRDPAANSGQKNSRRASKLNPNRVGAAWAEKRKLEMELEKREGIKPGDSDVDWLPNFGRVWQSGTRKESMKEFKKEKLKPAAESQAEAEMKLRPYVSKRTRHNINETSSEGGQHCADIS